MDKLKNVWLWMIVPLVAMQASIFVDYWGDFASNTWAVHVHYWIATGWYLFLISQPWLYARGKMDAHRTYGILGIGLAGAFAFTSISQLNRDLVYANCHRACRAPTGTWYAANTAESGTDGARAVFESVHHGAGYAASL